MTGKHEYVSILLPEDESLAPQGFDNFDEQTLLFWEYYRQLCRGIGYTPLTMKLPLDRARVIADAMDSNPYHLMAGNNYIVKMTGGISREEWIATCIAYKRDPFRKEDKPIGEYIGYALGIATLLLILIGLASTTL